MERGRPGGSQQVGRKRELVGEARADEVGPRPLPCCLCSRWWASILRPAGCSKLPYGAALNLNQSRAGLKSAICSTFFVFSSKLFQVCRGRVVGFGGAGVSGASRVSLVQAVRWCWCCWCKPGPDQARSPGMHRPGANLPPSLLHRL